MNTETTSDRRLPRDVAAVDDTDACIRSLALFPEQNPSPVFRVDSEGCLLYANPAGVALFEKRLITVGERVPDPIGAAVADAFAAGASHTLLLDVKQKTFSFDIVPMPAMGYANVYGRDVTEQKRNQNAATAAAIRTTAEQTAVDTVNAMGEGVALCDMRGRIRNVNPAFVALTDYERNDLLGRNIRDFLPGLFDEKDQTVWETMTRVQLKASAKDLTDALAVSTAKDVQKWVIPTLTLMHGPQREAVGIVLTLRDITALMQSQQKLQENEQQYRQLVENANSIIMRITPEHRITYFNEYAQHFFGYTADEVVGRSVFETITPEFDSAGNDLHKMTEAITAHPELHGTNDNENVCRDGRRVWIHWSNRAIRDAMGEVVEILCVGTDITARKRLEYEAAAYRRRLRALADRLTATEQQERRRVATQLHDTVIQTLSLSNIRLGGVMAAVEKAGLGDQKERIAGVRELLDQGIKECRGLMGDLVPTLLYEVGLTSALKAFARQQSKVDGTSITVTEVGAPKPLNDALRGLLFECARELIMNALKYAGKCEIRVVLSFGERDVQLQVLDTGKGFDVANVDATKHHDEHGGFGLFNIRERLESLAGRLDIESAPGKGTTATIVIDRL